MKSLVLVLLVGSVGLAAGGCAKVFKLGISREGRKEVVDVHNKYRKMIANEEVPDQPRGIDLLRMKYDRRLERSSRVVSRTCKCEHVKVSDRRFKQVGQNLHQIWNSIQDCSQNWTEAVHDWFMEHKYFNYDHIRLEKAGHYTQLMWADTFLVGCDFICFYDENIPQMPYSRLYTCNYAPGGNAKGLAPYQTGDSGCEDLC